MLNPQSQVIFPRSLPVIPPIGALQHSAHAHNSPTQNQINDAVVNNNTIEIDGKRYTEKPFNDYQVPPRYQIVAGCVLTRNHPGEFVGIMKDQNFYELHKP